MSDLFTAVDENLNFPPEVIKQLSESLELRNLVVPMTRADRENLKDAELWPGRTIYNTTTRQLETWHVDKWIKILNEDFIPPKFPDPWDRYFNLPSNVRAKLSSSEEIKTLVIPMSTTIRDSLLEDDLWDGRIIFNTTTNTLQGFIENVGWKPFIIFSDLKKPSGEIDSLLESEINALKFKELWDGRIVYNFTNRKYYMWDANYPIINKYGFPGWWVEVENNYSLIAKKLFKNNNLRYILFPMTNAVRDELTEDDLWDGRVIYNSTLKTLQVYILNVGWKSLVKSNDYSGIIPQVNTSSHFRSLLLPMTTVSRDSLSGNDLWDGRTIYNTTEKKLQVYVDEHGWLSLLRSDYNETSNVYNLDLIDPNVELPFKCYFLSRVRVFTKNNIAMLKFRIDFQTYPYGDPPPTIPDMILKFTLPIQPKNTNITNVGPAYLTIEKIVPGENYIQTGDLDVERHSYFGVVKIKPSESFMTIAYINEQNILSTVTSMNPQPWVHFYGSPMFTRYEGMHYSCNGMIEGNIMFEI